MLACWAGKSNTLIYSWVFYLVNIHFTLTWWRAIVSKKVNRDYKPKLLYNIYAFQYFAMHVIILIDLFKLWWLIMEYIFFWHFIFMNYFGKKFNIFFQNPYRFDTICFYKYVLNIFLMLLIKSIILMLDWYWNLNIWKCPKYHHNFKKHIPLEN